MSRVTYPLAALFLLASSCAGEDDSWDCDDGKCDIGGGTVVNTTKSNVTIFSGYHRLADTGTARCVELDGRPESFQIGSVSSSVEYFYVESRTDLATALGIDLGLKVRYGVVNADATLNLLKQFKASSNSVNVLAKVSADYWIANAHPGDVALNQTGLAELDDLNGFVQVCGSHYVTALRYGANVFALVSYEAMDEQSAIDVKATIAGGGGSIGGVSGPVKLDGDVSARFEEVNRLQGVSVSARIASQGLDGGSQVSLADLASGLSSDSHEKLDELRSVMASSVGNDRCRDEGGTCDGGASSGFPHSGTNSRRSSVLTGIAIAEYPRLANMSRPHRDRFRIVPERHGIVEQFLRDYGQLEEHMELIYRGEIEPFLSATTSHKATYSATGVLEGPSGAAPRTPQEVFGIASHWSRQFFPDSVPEMGYTFAAVVKAQQDCFREASQDLFYECTPGDVPAPATDEHRHIVQTIAAYSQARVLPLQYKVGKAVSFPKADRECRDFNTRDVTYRLPTLEEVRYLAPLIGFGPVSWTGERPHETWFLHPAPSSICSDPDYPHPIFRNPPESAEPFFRCVGTDSFLIFSGWKANPICVPSSGPFPLVASAP